MPDHGVPVRDLNTRNLPYVWVKTHEEFFKDTVLRHLPPDPRHEYASHDLFAEMLEPVRKRGMKLYGRILEPYTMDMAALMPNWSRVLTVDAWGRPGRLPCFYNPDYRNFWTGTAEDLFKTYQFDGFQFGGERAGRCRNWSLAARRPILLPALPAPAVAKKALTSNAPAPACKGCTNSSVKIS